MSYASELRDAGPGPSNILVWVVLEYTKAEQANPYNARFTQLLAFSYMAMYFFNTHELQSEELVNISCINNSKN